MWLLHVRGQVIMAGGGLRYELGDSLPVSSPVKYNTLVVPRRIRVVTGGWYTVWMNSESSWSIGAVYR
ncbi:MAG: hypothetical protein ACLUDU_03010 [Butyricimonas faecihominis]